MYDAWELSPGYRKDRIELAPPLSVTLDGENTTVLTVTVRRMIGRSPLEERIIVKAGSPRIEFGAGIDWQERHKLLKVHFESALCSDDAIHEMQFCHIRRPAHRSGAFGSDRFEVCNHHYSALFEAGRGVALLNRAIWGVSCDEGDLALTLLRAPCVPDDTCDRGHQRFEFALCVYDVPFALSTVTQDGYAYNMPPLLLSGQGEDSEGFRAENALIDTVKPAEDSTGTVIRLWEPKGTRANVTLRLPRPAQICACDFDEQNVQPLVYADSYSFELHAFEVRTLMIR